MRAERRKRTCERGTRTVTSTYDRLRSNASERLAHVAARSKSAARVASSGRSRADTIRDTR